MTITERELQLMRAEQEKFMPQRVIVKRKNYVSGEEIHIPAVIARDVPCRLTPGFGLWRRVADRFQGITAYNASFAYGADVKAGDELIDEQSRTFQVRDTLSPKSYETAVRVLLDRVSD